MIGALEVLASRRGRRRSGMAFLAMEKSSRQEANKE